MKDYSDSESVIKDLEVPKKATLVRKLIKELIINQEQFNKLIALIDTYGRHKIFYCLTQMKIKQ